MLALANSFLLMILGVERQMCLFVRACACLCAVRGVANQRME